MNIKCYDYIIDKTSSFAYLGRFQKMPEIGFMYYNYTKKVQNLNAYLFYVNMFMVKTRNKNKTKKFKKTNDFTL